MKIALIHDWFLTFSGAEKVFLQINKLFPGDIYALFEKDFFPKEKTVYTSYLNLFPNIQKYYRNLLPFYPSAIREFSLESYDLIISSSFCMAKNIKKSPHQIHICYCHSPARYLWDLKDTYIKSFPWYKKGIFHLLSKKLQKFDLTYAQDVDCFIANSHFVKKRIQSCYQKHAHVIYPPVDTDFFTPINSQKKDFFFTCARWVPYKKIDVIIRAFANLPNETLIVAGDGPEAQYYKKIATPNVTFIGKISDEELRSYFRTAKAFLYAAIEDFGMIMVEAIASGCPVIAFGEGGAKEIVKPHVGIVFPEQTSASLLLAIKKFYLLNGQYDAISMHQYAKQFSISRFNQELKEFVDTYIHSCRR